MTLKGCELLWPFIKHVIKGEAKYSRYLFFEYSYYSIISTRMLNIHDHFGPN